jgi:hypothetical protein
MLMNLFFLEIFSYRKFGKKVDNSDHEKEEREFFFKVWLRTSAVSEKFSELVDRREVLVSLAGGRQSNPSANDIPVPAVRLVLQYAINEPFYPMSQ